MVAWHAGRDQAVHLGESHVNHGVESGYGDAVVLVELEICASRVVIVKPRRAVIPLPGSQKVKGFGYSGR